MQKKLSKSKKPNQKSSPKSPTKGGKKGMKSAASKITKILYSPDYNLDYKKKYIMHLCEDSSPECAALLEDILSKAAHSNMALIFDEAKQLNSEELEKIQEKANAWDAMRESLKTAPYRHATFINLIKDDTLAVQRANVILESGDSATISVVDDKDKNLANSLKKGDTVVVDSEARILINLDEASATNKVGEELRFERPISDTLIEVSVRDFEKAVFHVPETVGARIKSGEIKPGATVIACTKRRFAFDVVPSEESISKYRFLSKSPVPDVIVERDIGSPHPCIDELSNLINMAMTKPELFKKYRLRKTIMRLLAGVSGSGKTLSIHGLWNRMYNIMSAVTGAAINTIPQRTITIKSSQIYSKWLGDSDKNFDRFFDEIEGLADEKFEVEGKSFTLPVLAIMEEVDAIARTRGGNSDAIYDRILTTGLQRLDSTRPEFQDRLIIFLATTNTASLIDPAFLRRIGGKVEKFGRLNRDSFISVLSKHLDKRPFKTSDGENERTAQKRVLRDVTNHLFSNSDGKQIEITYSNGQSEVKERSDFLTGAIVDRTIQKASFDACIQEYSEDRDSGISSELLIEEINSQIRSVVDQLDSNNIHYYLDLPDGVKVNKIVRAA